MPEPLYKNSRRPHHEPRTYFAFVECVEIIDSEFFGPKKIFVRLDCLMVPDARLCVKNKQITNGFLSELPLIQIECVQFENVIKKNFGKDVLEIEDKWIMIRTVPRTRLQQAVAFETYNGEETRRIFALERIQPTDEEKEILEGLGGVFDLENLGEANEAEIKRIITLKFSTFEKIIVAEVGQGNINYITSSGKPAVYFDMGGGTGMHKGTYRRTLLTCKKQDPLVILSHWDMDHIETAVRDVSNCALTWIVPNQKVGKTHYLLALRISTTGSLVIWPKKTLVISHSSGDIIRCTGVKKNDSGLAAVIHVKGDETLLPGDSAYDFISLTKYRLSALVASHHGSNSGCSKIPTANPLNRIAYSYGTPNKWKHPRSRAIRMHRANRWRRSRRTPYGSIVFDSSAFTCSCGCGLSAVQTF